MSMLSLREVRVSIAGARVLRDVSMELDPGSFTALVGRNGAGKTTMLRAIMGLVSTEGGALFLEGRPLGPVAPHRRAALGIGYAPEDRRLFSAFTVAENVVLPCRVAGIRPVEVERRLAKVLDLVPEVRDLLSRPAGQVSGGQGKMVALARALMTGDRLVLLDEPFQGLAPLLAQRYGDVLRDLRERPQAPSVLVTESNPALLSGLVDRVLRLERGAMVEDETRASGDFVDHVDSG